MRRKFLTGDDIRRLAKELGRAPRELRQEFSAHMHRIEYSTTTGLGVYRIEKSGEEIKLNAK
jgi:hypothetical protein